MYMAVLSAALLLAGEGATLPCPVLSADGFVAVKPPESLKGQAVLAGAGARLALASPENGKVSLWLWEGKNQWSAAKTLDPAGLDLRGLRVALGAENTLVLYDPGHALIFEDDRLVGALALPGIYPQEVRVEEDGIYFFLAPRSLSAGGSTPAVSFPGARPGAQPLVLRTTLKGTNPQVLLDYLPAEQEGLQQARALLENWIPSAGGRYVVFPYSGQVRWESSTGKQAWSAPAGVRFLYQEEGFQAPIDKAAEETKEELARKLKSQSIGGPEPRVIIQRPATTNAVVLNTPVFGTMGVKGRTLLATLHLAAKPPRSFLLYQPGWEQPRCWQLPESFKGVPFLTWVNSAVNDQGLWLDQPLGYFPWQLLEAEQQPSQEDLER